MGAIPLGHLHDVALILNFERCWAHALEVHVHTQDDTGVWAKQKDQRNDADRDADRDAERGRNCNRDGA